MRGEAIHPVPKPQKAVKPRRYMRRKSARRIAKEGSEERAFMDWLHKQECCAKGNAFIVGGSVYTTTHWCFAGMYGNPPVEASHFRDHTGMGRKESDLTCIPLCREMHDDYDGRRPHMFAGWSIEAKKDWHRLRQKETQERWKAARR